MAAERPSEKGNTDSLKNIPPYRTQWFSAACPLNECIQFGQLGIVGQILMGKPAVMFGEYGIGNDAFPIGIDAGKVAGGVAVTLCGGFFIPGDGLGGVAGSAEAVVDAGQQILPLPVARLRCTAVAGGCERFGMSSAEAAETAWKAFAFTFGDAVKVCGLNFGITAALASEFAPNGKSVQPTCAVFDLRGASRIKAAGTDTRQGVDKSAELFDFLTVIHGLIRKEKSDFKNIKWLPIPNSAFQTASALFTMSVSGQRGLTLKPPAATACSARIAPAKAIIAPLSVQYSMGGK